MEYRNKQRVRRISLPLLLALLLLSCGGGSHGGWPNPSGTPGDTITRESELLTMIDFGDYTAVEVADPWNEGSLLGRFALVPRGSSLPEGLPEDVKVVRTPVGRAAVYSAVHASALEELGSERAIVAVADGMFFPASGAVSAGLSRGEITDVGPAASPSPEKLASSSPELVMISPMEGVALANAVIEKLPLVSMPMADYMEPSALSRAEWILLVGELFGERQRAAEIFDDVRTEYERLRCLARDAESPAPKVITETEVSGVWYVPCGGSYMARMLADAGALYPWADTPGGGSLALDMESVLARGHDCDIWLMRPYGYEVTRESLAKANQLNVNFKAFKDDGIYFCNTAERPIFNDVAFHPERILADYVAIFHPEIMPGYSLRYFKKAQK